MIPFASAMEIARILILIKGAGVERHFPPRVSECLATRHGAGNTANSAKGEIWLPFLDTYRTMCLAPQPDFRRVLENVRAMQLAA